MNEDKRRLQEVLNLTKPLVSLRRHSLSEALNRARKTEKMWRKKVGHPRVCCCCCQDQDTICMTITENPTFYNLCTFLSFKHRFFYLCSNKNKQEIFLQRQTAFDRCSTSINATLGGEWVNMAVLIRELERSFLISCQWRCLKSRGDCDDDSCRKGGALKILIRSDLFSVLLSLLSCVWAEGSVFRKRDVSGTKEKWLYSCRNMWVSTARIRHLISQAGPWDIFKLESSL